MLARTSDFAPSETSRWRNSTATPGPAGQLLDRLICYLVQSSKKRLTSVTSSQFEQHRSPYPSRWQAREIASPSGRESPASASHRILAVGFGTQDGHVNGNRILTLWRQLKLDPLPVGYSSVAWAGMRPRSRSLSL
jgi:hypothetical protein